MGDCPPRKYSELNPWLCPYDSLLDKHRRPCIVSEIKPGLTAYKTITLTSILFLWLKTCEVFVT